MAAKRHRILVVDDSSTIRTQVVESLKGYADCVEAENGERALHQLRVGHFDAAVSDVEMPVMDGVSLLRAVKQDPDLKAVPIIIITTVTAIDVVNQCRTLGCAGFVLKPVNRDYLLAKLRRLLKDA